MKGRTDDAAASKTSQTLLRLIDAADAAWAGPPEGGEYDPRTIISMMGKISSALANMPADKRSNYASTITAAKTTLATGDQRFCDVWASVLTAQFELDAKKKISFSQDALAVVASTQLKIKNSLDAVTTAEFKVDRKAA